jgi:hypothetical protein
MEGSWTMNQQLSTDSCKKRLSLLWFLGGLFIFLILVYQSQEGKFGAQVGDVWSWFLPTIMPTLSLMVGVFILDATTGRRPKMLVDRYFYRVAFGLSAFYLVLVALPLIKLHARETLELLGRSNLWLGPLQGLTTATLGAFFVKSEQQPLLDAEQ